MTSGVDSAWEKLGVKVCSICQFKASHIGIFQSHICIKKKTQITISFKKQCEEYSCSICKVSQNKYEFTEHLQHHLLEKPFKCSFCDDEFETKNETLIHFKHTHPLMTGSYKLKVATDTENFLDIARSKGFIFITPLKRVITLKCAESNLGTDKDKQNLSSTETPGKQIETVVESASTPRTQHGNEGGCTSGDSSCPSGNIVIQTNILQHVQLPQLPNVITLGHGPRININQGSIHTTQLCCPPVQTSHIISPTDQYSTRAHALGKPLRCPKKLKESGHVRNTLQGSNSLSPKHLEGGADIDKCIRFPSVSMSLSTHPYKAIEMHVDHPRAEHLQQNDIAKNPPCLPRDKIKKSSAIKTISQVPANIVPDFPKVMSDMNLDSIPLTQLSHHPPHAELPYAVSQASIFPKGLQIIMKNSPSSSRDKSDESEFIAKASENLNPHSPGFVEGTNTDSFPLCQTFSCPPQDVISNAVSPTAKLLEEPCVYGKYPLHPGDKLDHSIGAKHAQRVLGNVSPSSLESSRGLKKSNVPSIQSTDLRCSSRGEVAQSDAAPNIPVLSDIQCSKESKSTVGRHLSPVDKPSAVEHSNLTQLEITTQSDNVGLGIVKSDCGSQITTSVKKSSKDDDYSYLSIFYLNNEIVYICSSCKLRFKDRNSFIRHIWEKHAHSLDTISSCSLDFDVECPHLQRVMKVLNDKAKGFFDIYFQNDPTAASVEKNNCVKNENVSLSDIKQLSLSKVTCVNSGIVRQPHQPLDRLTIISEDPSCITQLEIKVEAQEEIEGPSLTDQNEEYLSGIGNGAKEKISTLNVAYDNLTSKVHEKTSTGDITGGLIKAEELRGDTLVGIMMDTSEKLTTDVISVDIEGHEASKNVILNEKVNTKTANDGNLESDLCNLAAGEGKEEIVKASAIVQTQSNLTNTLTVEPEPPRKRCNNLEADTSKVDSRGDTDALHFVSLKNVEGRDKTKGNNGSEVKDRSLQANAYVKPSVSCNLLEHKNSLTEKPLVEMNLDIPSGTGHTHTASTTTTCNFYKCAFSDCDYSSCRPVDFLFHAQNTHGMESTYLCFYCGFEGQSTAALLDHMQSHLDHSSDSYSGLIWKNSKVLVKVEHGILNTSICLMESKQENISSASFSCNMCESKFSSLQTLKNHWESATLKTYGCNYCRSNFLDSKSAEKHSREEHPSKPRFRRQYVKLLCKDRVVYKESCSKLVKVRNDRSINPNSNNSEESDKSSSAHFELEGSKTMHAVETPVSLTSLQNNSNKALSSEPLTSQVSSSADLSACEQSLSCAETQGADVEVRTENTGSPQTIQKHAEKPIISQLDGNHDEQFSSKQKELFLANTLAPDNRTSHCNVKSSQSGVENGDFVISKKSLSDIPNSSGKFETTLTTKENNPHSFGKLTSKSTSYQMERIYDLCAEDRTAKCLSSLYSQKEDGFYSCNQCGESRSRLRRMLCHIFFCQGKVSVVMCSYDCSFEGEHTSLIVKHIKEKHPKEYPSCPYCKNFRCINVDMFFKFLEDKEVTQTVLEMACKSDKKQRRAMMAFGNKPKGRACQSTGDKDETLSSLSVKECLKKCSQFENKRKSDINIEGHEGSIIKLPKSAEDASSSSGDELCKDIHASKETPSSESQQHLLKMSLPVESIAMKLSSESNDPAEKDLLVKTNNTLESVRLKTLKHLPDTINIKLPKPSEVTCVGTKSVPQGTPSSKDDNDKVSENVQPYPEMGQIPPELESSQNVSLSSETNVPGRIQRSSEAKQSSDYLQIPEVDEDTHILILKRADSPCELKQNYKKELSMTGKTVTENQELKSEKAVSVLQKSNSAEMISIRPVFDRNSIYKCKICSSKFHFDIDCMKRHISETHSFFTCGYCDNPYYSIQFLRSHIRFAHDNSKIKFNQIPLEMVFIRVDSTFEDEAVNLRVETVGMSNIKKGVPDGERDGSIHQTVVKGSESSSVLKANDLNCQNVNAIYFESQQGKDGIESSTTSMSPSPPESHGLNRPIVKEIRPRSNDDEDSHTCTHFKENLSEMLCEGQASVVRSSPLQQKIVSMNSLQPHGGSNVVAKRKVDETLNFDGSLLHSQQKYIKQPHSDQSDSIEAEMRSGSHFSSSDHTDTSIHETLNQFSKGTRSNPASSSESEQHGLAGGENNSTLRPLSYHDLYWNGKALSFKLFGGLFICRSCKTSFPSISEVKVHVNAEHSDMNAGWTEQRTGVKYSIGGHKLFDMTDVRPSVTRYLCGYCIFQSKLKKSISQHMISAHSSMEYHYVLPLCEDEAVAYTEKCCACSEEEPNFGCPHEAVATANSGFLQYNCHLCDMCLPSEFLFRHHLAKHGGFKHCSTLSTTTGLLLCATCGYLAMSSSDLANHTSRHMTERRFSCSICGFDDHHRKGICVHISKYHNATSCARVIDSKLQNRDLDIRPRLVDLQPYVALEEIDC